MFNRYYFLTLFWLLLTALSAVHAQDKLPVKFGKVTPLDFAVTAAGPDSSADAIVVADYGTSAIVGNLRGWFALEFRHSKRIKIIKRTGFEAATIALRLYTSSSESEKILNLRASTYNLEDGKVVEAKLDSKSIFTDKISKDVIEEKFTFPALKEGSILEYSYIHTSPFLFNLQPWEFQGQYPCLWSEYQVELPNFFEYVTLSQGYVPFKISTTETRHEPFQLFGNLKYDDEVVTHRWVMKNIPALREEPYTTTIKNYIARLEFQLSRYNFNYTGAVPKDVMGNWDGLSQKLLASDNFGADLENRNPWLDDELKNITKGAEGGLEKAQRIYTYIRDNFTCTFQEWPFA